MTISGRINIKMLLFGLAFVFSATEAAINSDSMGGRRLLGAGGGTKVFDVTKYGAKGDGKHDSTMAFMKTWVDACQKNTEPAKFIVPKGTFVIGPVVFQGPCKRSSSITVQVQGTVQATTDLSDYTDDAWVIFERIDGLVLTGGGTFDGQGPAVWKYDDCKGNKDCTPLPVSIKFQTVNNSVINGITSINSKFFHYHITDSNNFAAHNLKITAPGDSPNTDGMHISESNGVNITNSVIGTGDDCISIGPGVTNATFSQITCGPGHGISIGSLGKRSDEKDVRGILVKNSTFIKTTNGVRIKTWAGSPPGVASGITFQDLTMKSVQNAIIIDQQYGSKSGKPSKVAVSDVQYKNIKGTTTSDYAVNFVCSKAVPCKGIELVNIDLTCTGKSAKSSASCANAKVSAKGARTPTC